MRRSPTTPTNQTHTFEAGSPKSTRRLVLIAGSTLLLGLPLAVQADIVANQFAEATAGGVPVIDSPGETWGGSWGDFDGDGDPDLWMGKHQFTPSALFRNNGNGSFTDVIDSAVINAVDHYTDDTHGAAWADFDNDGDQDLIEVCGAGAGAVGTDPVISDNWRNNLYVNSGGILAEDALSYGEIEYPTGRSRTPLWLDFDTDGLLDFAISALQTTPEQAPSAVLRQELLGFFDANAATGFPGGSCQNMMLGHLGPGGEPALICGGGVQIQSIHDISVEPFIDLRPVLGNAVFNAFVYDMAIGDFNGDLRPDIFAGITPPSLSAALRVGPANDRIHAYLAPSATERGFSFTAPGDVVIEFGWETDEQDIFLGANAVPPPADADQGLQGPDRFPHHVQFTLSTSNSSYLGMSGNRSAGIYIGYVSGRWEVRVVNAGADVNVLVRAGGISAPAAIGDTSLTQGAPVAPAFFENQPGGLVALATGDVFLDPLASVQTYARSVVAGDLDNDMDLDVYVGSSGRVANVPNLLFDNQGDGTFRLVSNGAGAAGASLGRTDTVTLVDYDQDGFLDLFATQGNYPAPFSYDAQQQLFRNQGNANHWVLINLRGVISNRDGVGAVVYASTPDGKIQLREQANGVHRYAQDYVQTHFGLGANTTVDLEVHWPSGVVESFNDLAADQIYTLVEGTGGGGGGPTSPTCGEPTYDKASESALFVWNDCGTNDWHVRVTAGGQTLSYQGSLTSDVGFTTMTAFSYEGNDVLPPNYVMNVGNTGQDGLDFSFAAGANVCLTLDSPSLPVYAGANRVLVDSAVSLPDFGACDASGFILSAGNVTVDEGAGTAVFTVNLSPAPGSGQSVVVSYQTQNGSAVAGSDYTTTAGTLTYTQGQTQKTVSVPITDDATAEGTESFSLQLSSAVTNAVSATASILDNDGGSTLPACGQPSYDKATETAAFIWNDCGTNDWHVRVTAGGQVVSYQGTLTSDQGFTTMSPFSFEANDVLPPNYVMNVGNTGQDGLDFSFPTGAAVCFTLDSPSNLPVYAGSDRVLMGSAMSLPDFGACDASGFILSAGDVTVTENAGTAVFTVNLSPAPGAGESVVAGYQTQDGSAVAGSDYTTTAGTLTFTAGQTQETVSVPITNDGDPESSESFTLTLTSADTNTVNASATILDDDSAGTLPACGEPTYNKATETAAFIWNDCGTNDWHVRVTAGGQFVSYQGTLTSNQAFASLAAFSYEANDVLPPNYVMNVGNTGHDGLDYSLQSGAAACFTLDAPSNLPVYAGSNRVTVGNTVNSVDYGPCTPL